MGQGAFGVVFSRRPCKNEVESNRIRRGDVEDPTTGRERVERIFQELPRIFSDGEARVSTGKAVLDLFSGLSFVDAVLVRLERTSSRNARTFPSSSFPSASPAEKRRLSAFLGSMGPLPVILRSSGSGETPPPPEIEAFCRTHGFRQAIFLPLFSPDTAGGKKGTVALFLRKENEGDLFFDTLVLKSFSLLPLPLPSLPADLDNLVRFYKALHEINHLIARHPPPELLYDEVCRIAVAYAGLRLAWIATLDRPDGGGRILSVCGPASGYADGLFFTADANSPYGQGPAGRSFREGRILVAQIDTDPEYAVWRERAHRFGLHSSCSFPFKRHGRIEGVMGVYAEDPHYFSPSVVALLSRLSEDMEFSLESFDRSTRIEKLQMHIRSLLEITEEIAKRPDQSTLFDHVTSLVVEKIGAVFSAVILGEEDGGLSLAAQAGPLLGFEERAKMGFRSPSEPSPVAFGLVSRVLATGRTLVADSFAWSPAFVLWRPLFLQRGILSGAGFPLVVEGKVIGLLVVGSREEDFFSDEIVDLLENMVENISFAIQDIRRKEHLEFLGYHDDLTALPNRTSFLETLASALSGDRQIAVAILDIDNFKEINDSMGHAAGDRVLVEAARRLSGLLGPEDFLARLGGDEFALVLYDRTGPAEIEEFWKALSRSFDNPILIEEFSSGIFQLTASMGVALSGEGGLSPGELLKHADQALYFSKESGRNSWSLYTSALTERVERTFGIRRAFRTGLERGEMSLYLQPQVDLRSGEVSGAEALVRWKDPRSGEIRLPGSFLPVVENDLSQVSLLGEWVLEEAYRLLSTPDMKNAHLSVNIGALHFLHKNFLAHVDSFHLRQPEIGPRLTIEITEAVALSHLDQSARTIRALAERGITVSLDDFGTGFGSLSYLNNLPVREIKIDQSFIRNMTFRPGDFAIVSGTMLTAGLRQIQVVAEGLENLETGLALLRMGCHYAQGFGIGRPMPVRAFFSWKDSWHPPEIWRKGRHSHFLYRGIDLLVAQVELRGFRKEASVIAGPLLPDDPRRQSLSRVLERLRKWLGNGLQRFGTISAYRRIAALLGEIESQWGSASVSPSGPEMGALLDEMDKSFSELVDAVDVEGR
jgi:diguanylate cyclase (GGDEF)-like protein